MSPRVLSVLAALLVVRGLACHTNCLTCAAGVTSQYDCSVCSPGVYPQPNGKYCLSTCPSGYTPNANTALCEGDGKQVFGLPFTSPAVNWIESVSGKTVIAGVTQANNWDGKEPLYAPGRGLSFDGSKVLQLADYPRLSTSFSVVLFVHPRSPATLVRQWIVSNSGYRVHFTYKTQTGTKTVSEVVSCKVHAVNQWQKVVVTMLYDPSLSQPISACVHVGGNGAFNSPSFGSDPMIDFATFTTQIGGSLDSSNSLSSGFDGYIYMLSIYNYALTQAEIAAIFAYDANDCPSFGCLATDPDTQFSGSDCHPWCRTCSGTAINTCGSCPQPNYYLFSGICVNACPIGTVVNSTSAVCDASQSTAAVLAFNFTNFNNSQWSLGNETYIAQGASSSVFPSYDAYDPYLIQGRGLFFRGNAYATFGPYPSNYNSVVLRPTHTVTMWVRTQSAGSPVLLSKTHTDYNREIVRFSLESGNTPSVRTVLYAASGTVTQCEVQSEGSLDSAWRHIGYSLSSNQGEYTLKIYIDDQEVTSNTCTGFFFDSQPSVTTLGALYDSENVAYSNYFTGFISALTLFPTAVTDFPPSPAPLSSSNYLQTVSGDPCNGNCNYGCVRTTDCVLNTDPLCKTYLNYTACLACGTRAIRWRDGLCHCKYFSQIAVDYSNAGLCTCPSDWPGCDVCPRFLSANNVSYLAFSSSYLGIEVGFTGFVNATLHTNNCAKTFNVTTLGRLGDSPKCAWRNNTFLSVTFGVNATLVAGHTVEFLPQYFVTNTYDCSTVPEAEMKNVSVYVHPFVNPKARLSAPAQYTTEYDEDLVLDGSASGGFLNRPGMYQWRVASDVHNAALANYFSDTFYSGKSVLRVRASALLPATLRVTLTVKNYLDVTSTKDCVVIVSAGKALQLSFNTPQIVEMTRAATRTFTVSADVTNLPPNPVLSYQWSLFKTIPPSFMDLSPVLSSSPLASTLAIPKFTLFPGYQYIFRANVSESLTLLTGYLDLYLTMIQSNVTVTLSRISGAVESWKRVLLTATVTNLDNMPESTRNVAWTCFNSSQECEGGTVSEGNSTYLLPSERVSPGAKLNLTVYAMVAGKTASANVAFEVLEEPVPIVTMRCLAQKVNPSSSYRCGAGIDYGGVGMTYQWRLTKGDISGFAAIKDTVLLVKPGLMFAGKSYTFTFEVYYGLVNRKLSVDLQVITNSPPINGDFRVFPSSGYELTTSFSCSAPSWEDDDLPITYAFSYLQGSNSVKVNPRSESQVYSSMLPAGSAPSYRLRLVLSVWDALDTVTNMDKDVVVSTKAYNGTEVMSILGSALNVSLESLSSIPGTCTTIGPKVVSSNLTINQLSSAYSSIIGGLSQYSAISATPDADSTADCLQVFSSNMADVDPVARKSTLSLVSFLTASTGEISPDLGGKLLGSIGSVMNASTDGEITLNDVQSTIESIGNGIMSKSLPGESVAISKPGITAQLEMHWGESLAGRVVSLADSNSTAAIPKNFSAIAGMPRDTVFQLAAYSLPAANSSSINATVLKLDLSVTGKGDTRNVVPTPVNVSSLFTPISFSIYAPGLPSSATTSSVFCTYYIPENSTWSSLGLSVVSLNTTSGLITCNTSHLSVFSAGIASAADTATGANLGELVDFGNLSNLDEKNAVGIYVCAGIWALYVAVGAYALMLDKRSTNSMADKRREKAEQPKTEKDVAMQTSGLFLKEIQARAAKSSAMSRTDITQEHESYDSSRTITESPIVDMPTMKSPVPERPAPHKPKKRISFKEMMLDEHMIVNILVKYNETFPRFNRLTMFLVMIMGEMFVSGLFYDNGSAGVNIQDSAEMKDFVDSMKSYSWGDFWVAVYSSLLMIPPGVLLGYLLSRKKVISPQIEDLTVGLHLKERTLRIEKIKKYVGYGLSWSLMAFFTYSIIMYSLAFHHCKT